MAEKEDITASANSTLEYYQCSQCHKRYSRVDHLARHVRSHLQQKPFECTVCNKGFGRPDVLKRHALSHEPVANDPKRQSRHVGQSSRVAQACKACAIAKLKCEDEKPCRRCQQKHMACDYGSEVRYTSSYHSENSPQIISSSQTDHTPTSLQHDPSDAQHYMHGREPPTPDTDTREKSDVYFQSSDTSISGSLSNQGDFSDFLRDVVTVPHLQMMNNHAPPPMGWGVQHQDYWPRDVLDFTLNNNLGLESVDFSILHAVNGITPAGYSGGAAQKIDRAETAREYTALGSEAFENSPVSRWNPSSDDSVYMDQKHLALPEDKYMQVHPDRMMSAEHVDLRSRDAILAMVLSICAPDNVSTVVASFPTAGVLDSLMQWFFIQHHPQIGSWIHFQTFKPSVDRLELLCGIVAAGAVLAGSKSLQKFGFALHESLQLSITRRCELDNSLTRKLWILQALMLDLDISLWSGNPRKMELAECKQQILITMMRRGGKFQRSRAPPIVPLVSDTGEVLTEKWHQWIEQESLKRVVFHAYLHNSQISLSLHVNPIVSYTELSLQLPEANDLWNAGSAEDWKAIYLSKTYAASMRTLSVLDVIREPTTLAPLEEFCDLQFSALIVLHGFWGIIWDYTQMNSVFKNTVNTNASLIMKSSHEQLCHALLRFRMSILDWSVDPLPEVLLIFDLLLMYLHVSLEDIQLFAGKEGKEEACRVFPLLKQWIGSVNCREALWHAAQVLRRARSFSVTSLRDFYAVAVYHASIAFWAYGVIAKVKPPMSADSLPIAEFQGADAYVFLDGETNAEVEHYVGLGHGVPCISPDAIADPTELACMPLSEPEPVMEILIRTLKLNFVSDTREYPLPPMVENLVKLMKNLGKATRSLT